jgi:ABC-type protease/lipase transport system fused ATPase/permease subunit
VGGFGLEFTIHSGEYLCIVGKTAPAKARLSKALLGSKTPSEGSIVDE